MTHLNFIIAAYAVFVAVLGWDYLSTRLQIRRQLRNARLRAAREASRPGPGDKSATELIR
ncbi:heme exporter protein CcmD [Pseudoxanthomonas wuyuanensis]|uniref:Heme exporter protein D n=1 Tax=Pseudoxanthomonas wuyuanensis TaxID=1073196 RepID=A0A286D8Y2_9GAMM|nr:heme exporter protein CcmD [Pseudoxanthomonas wuyuanensis]KAF1722136.1 heme exporter protein CcmD [Pseudoxanthomonas wuyuanensis]SOD55111.1 heme exporter protein D [Pseudoxanthomonas wuyuanensis]